MHQIIMYLVKVFAIHNANAPSIRCWLICKYLPVVQWGVCVLLI